jgi:hypothetical protein
MVLYVIVYEEDYKSLGASLSVFFMLQSEDTFGSVASKQTMYMAYLKKIFATRT